jgi:DNA-binding NarL/FixJ family response regulator
MKRRNDMTVLLLEDQPLIAIDTEAMLRRAGFGRIVHLSSIGSVVDWLRTSAPDFVIMETVLQGETSATLAEQLTRRNVPLLVYTGASRRLTGASLFSEHAWLPKPSETEQMLPAIAAVLGDDENPSDSF